MKKINLSQKFSQFIFFVKNEEAAVFLLVAASIFMLIAAGGGALDAARYLIAQNRMQMAIDSATVAAASQADKVGPGQLNQIARNYFEANMPEGALNTTGIQVSVAYNNTTGEVTGTADGDVHTLFMNMFGFPELSTSAGATVIWSSLVDRLEVGLVLDVSPSMCKSGVVGPGNPSADYTHPQCIKLRAVHDASINFIDKVFESDTPETSVLMGVVPFGHTVNNTGNGIGSTPNLFNQSSSNPNVFSDTRVTRLLPLRANPNAVKARIDQLKTNTKIWTRQNIGLRAAFMLLSPNFNSYFNHTQNPLPFDPSPDADVKKAVVLMSDGENTVYGVCQNDSTPCPVHYFYNPQDNTDTINVCNALKARGVIIYTIGVNLVEKLDPNPANQPGLVLQQCATSPVPPYYQDVDCGSTTFNNGCVNDVDEAFEEVANSLRKLRITE